MPDFFRYEVDGGIATITIDRPEKKGAMTYAMLGDFIALVHEAGRDDAARVVLITGAPGTFCAGTDLSDLQTIPGKERGTRGTAEQTDVWWPIVQCPKPVIAAVDGPAIGMGVEFTSQCDVRIASTRARFGWVFVHRGLVPDTGAGTWLLPRLIGVPAALDLLYSGRIIEADEALALGFVREVVEPDALLERARAVAESYLAGSPFAIRRIKELAYKGLERSVGEHMTGHVEALSACFKSEDHAEGVASFLERRPAQFTGR
ncbi:MAG TPA: enoyl-CoA hydratase/isomerase family protein [Acidimicrobiales bacterium]|nr:enoyl-CoA hydratase/isomerase family protein [Acidimicrobiales bacterium]